MTASIGQLTCHAVHPSKCSRCSSPGQYSGVPQLAVVCSHLHLVLPWRMAGPVGAWISAAAVLALIQTFGIVERLPNVWNPWAIVVPVLLLILLCAMLADRGRPVGPPLAGALACGTFLVQTHLSTGEI